MLSSSILPGTAARWLQFIDLFPWTSSTSSNASHSSLTPSQLFLGLTDHYDPETHVESIIVKTIWYGKRQGGARHEFLLIDIEDSATQMQNFLVLDRNNTESANLGDRGVLGGLGLGSRAFKGVTLDAFRISRDGSEDQLMTDCNLKPRVYLQKLEIAPEQPLYLYQLATLALIVSRDHPTYSADLHNCYFFAGLIWAAIQKFRPKAELTNRLGGQRGRFGPLLYVLSEEEINGIYTAFDERLKTVESNLAKTRRDWLRLKPKAPGSRSIRKGSSESWPEALFPKKSSPSRMPTIEELPEVDNEKPEITDGSALVPAVPPRLSMFRRSRERLRSLIGRRPKER
ncbi:unnamed protein product [Rhizoctonia solani]|uniref:Uncharacterized protein n=1 Tax=Rhizoctonia solani TaxID=456999 RepID=A0A8H3HJ28_9AGAM|nr:unnamed protein product [Rhizoctonia solani]